MLGNNQATMRKTHDSITQQTAQCGHFSFPVCVYPANHTVVKPLVQLLHKVKLNTTHRFFFYSFVSPLTTWAYCMSSNVLYIRQTFQPLPSGFFGKLVGTHTLQWWSHLHCHTCAVWYVPAAAAPFSPIFQCTNPETTKTPTARKKKKKWKQRSPPSSEN